MSKGPLGKKVKRKEVRELIQKHKIDICCLQETKMESFSDIVCKSIWGHSKFDWSFKASVGRSGGIISLWNSDIFSKTSSWDTNGMLVINGHFTADGMRGVLINVYASCSYAEKRELWENINLVIDQYREACICVAGDFNAVRVPEERVGRGENGDTRDMANFDIFIKQCNLVDMPLSGRHSHGTEQMVLVNSDWIVRWPRQVLKGLKRTISDHCPIYLEGSYKDWGPRPFRIVNAWVKHPQFKEFCASKWNSYQVDGWATFRLKEKLKLLRGDLKVWNREVFGMIEHNIDEKQKEVEKWDCIDDTFGLEENEVIERNRCSAELLRYVNWKENLVFQKAKVKWLLEGDVNSGYFYGWVNKRRKINEIDGLFIDGVWTESIT
ncbi:hypothetical protein ACS0TY_026168 [Phlomoides rotata]